MTTLTTKLATLASCSKSEWIKDDLIHTKDKGKGVTGYLKRVRDCVVNYIKVHWFKKEDAYAHYASAKVMTAVEELFKQHHSSFKKTDAQGKENKELLGRALKNFDQLTHQKHAARIKVIQNKALELFNLPPAKPEVKPEVKPQTKKEGVTPSAEQRDIQNKILQEMVLSQAYKKKVLQAKPLVMEELTRDVKVKKQAQKGKRTVLQELVVDRATRKKVRKKKPKVLQELTRHTQARKLAKKRKAQVIQEFVETTQQKEEAKRKLAEEKLLEQVQSCKDPLQLKNWVLDKRYPVLSKRALSVLSRLRDAQQAIYAKDQNKTYAFTQDPNKNAAFQQSMYLLEKNDPAFAKIIMSSTCITNTGFCNKDAILAISSKLVNKKWKKDVCQAIDRMLCSLGRT